jgi:hypothetical protein
MLGLAGSPGACSVSTKCYQPNVLVEEWIMPRLAQSPNLEVFLRAAVTAVERDAATGAITSITAVQRKPRANHTEWSQPLSRELPDWYSPLDSAAFTKTTIVFRGTVFVEATELGDVLATSKLPFLQGVEAPFENSSNILSTCGQASTLTFYATRLAPDAPVPPGESSVPASEP